MSSVRVANKKQSQEIDPRFTNTPASAQRTPYNYTPRRDGGVPAVSILTAYYNMGPLFWETVRNVLGMSYTQWEWLIVDDGSVDQESLAQLERVKTLDPRIRVIHQPNAGPGVARNTAFAQACGAYLFQLDCDDLVEATFVEKALWFLETHPQFGACGSWVMTFGAQNFTWARGFNEYAHAIVENPLTNIALIRREAWEASGGYDPAADRGHEDWDFWLNMAEAGYWGYTISEYLTWYRRSPTSRLTSVEGDQATARHFKQWMRTKHAGLSERFPHPERIPDRDRPHAEVSFDAIVHNPLAKPTGVKRVLCVYPWLEIGGADKFNLDMVRQLSARGYQFTIVTTQRSENPWLANFRSVTPDIFCLDAFLDRADYPRFLDYLIETRQIDAVLLSNSEFGYLLAPYLHARHPDLPILDYNHMEEENWNGGGHPATSLRAGRLIDLNVVCTNHLKQWMMTRGADGECVDVVYCCLDTSEWGASEHDASAVRRELKVDEDVPLLLFVGRMVEQKRPMHVARIVKALAAQRHRFVAVFVGAGPDLDAVQRFISHHRLDAYVRYTGAQTNDRVREIMAASDILLLPSEHEGLALVLYEALAMGVVPVAADVGGHAELVTSECGYLIPHSDDEIEAYIAAISSLLVDPTRRRLFGLRGQQRVTEQFDIALMAEGMDQAFQRAAQLAQARPAAVNLSLARYTAHVAVEAMRLHDVSDYLWGQLTSGHNGKTRVRVPLKRRILPFGSRRHETWKRVRSLLGGVVRAPRSLLRRPAGNDRAPQIAAPTTSATPTAKQPSLHTSTREGQTRVLSTQPTVRALDAPQERTPVVEKVRAWDGEESNKLA